MAIQYPDFNADPNAVPKIGGWPEFIKSFQQGYQLSQMPQQMRMKQAMMQAQLQHQQDENRYYPQQQQQALDLGAEDITGKRLSNQAFPAMNAAQLAELKARTGQTYASIGLTNEQLAGARLKNR